ncbi:hypothetical protein HHI36_001289 [Cryptolaemus montrouzieri]|uniref:Uncharacterized protein n=1 Tax=Cryptolaemus montrouzieri TaxID=559131 RepID=A0ABD2P7E9_9CUCU
MKKSVPVINLKVNSFPVTLKRDTVIAESRLVCAGIGTVTSPASSSRNKCPQQLLDLLTLSYRDLDNQQTITVIQLIEEYHDVLATDDDMPGKTGIVHHKIITGDSQSIRQHPRRPPLAEREEAEKIITDKERQGITEPSSSHW